MISSGSSSVMLGEKKAGGWRRYSPPGASSSTVPALLVAHTRICPSLNRWRGRFIQSPRPGPAHLLMQIATGHVEH